MTSNSSLKKGTIAIFYSTMILSLLLILFVILSFNNDGVVAQKTRTRQTDSSLKAIAKVSGPNGVQGTIRFDCMVSNLYYNNTRL